MPRLLELLRANNDLGKTFIHELEEFFVDYHKLSEKEYRILDVRGPGEARRRIKDGIRAFNKEKRQ